MQTVLTKQEQKTPESVWMPMPKKKPLYEKSAEFPVMLCVNIQTGEILIDRRKEHYWKLP